MKKLSATNVLVACCMLISVTVMSQPAIIGPDCVLSGAEYQYNIKGNITEGAKLCVNGGTISGISSACTTDLGSGYVRIVWTAAKGSVTFSSSEGKTSIDVSVTTPLQSGTITTTKAEFINFKAACSAVSCSKPSGGGCGATYSYQWQRSLNNLVWEDIKGATGQNLGSLSLLTDSYFYRRKLTENVSGTVVYSDVTVVYVAPDTKTN